MKSLRHVITFEDSSDQACLVRAQLGIGNREIKRLTGLTDGQITYRLAKAKRGLGRERGFRVDWRNGNHPLMDRILRDYEAIMVKEIERKLVPVFEHATPQVRIPK